VVSLLLGRTVVCHCESMPVKPNLQLSVVTMNGMLSNFGLFSTGSLVRVTFSPMKAFSCSSSHMSISECTFMAISLSCMMTSPFFWEG
jgi:hypothetical protein